MAAKDMDDGEEVARGRVGWRLVDSERGGERKEPKKKRVTRTTK
jgi:hypothetical protein